MPCSHPSVFDAYLAHWNLTRDGEPLCTHSSDLLPVRRDGMPALMLKLAREEEERWGWLLMEYWNGDGAARVVAHDHTALLMERATGPLSLTRMAREGRDDDASRILCATAAQLHAPRPGRLPSPLVSLREWFAPLAPIAQAEGGLLAVASGAADRLLREPREIVVLHGDLHHGNVLDGGARGWLAIDPKRLHGERGFDFANVLRNPDIAWGRAPDADRFARQVRVVADAAALQRIDLLNWVLAFSGLSASWYIADGVMPIFDLAMAECAAAELARS